MPEPTPSRGVFFLANDRVIDITIAFLNSFRVHNPTLPLCLIPFNGEMAKITALADVYNFSIYSNTATLQKCDQIALGLSGQPCGAYRKFCAFDGPFEQFIYIDCDTLVLQNVEFFFQHLENFDWVCTHSDFPVLKQFVWKNTIDSAGLLSPEQIAFSANTGCFCAHRGAFDIDQALADLPAVAASFAPHMDFWYMEQPYMNYWVVTSGVRYSSLERIRHASRNSYTPREHWAGGTARLDKSVFLLHWAGCWSATEADKLFYQRLARFGIKTRSPGVRRALPHKRLWQRYRYMKVSTRKPAAPALYEKVSG